MKNIYIVGFMGVGKTVVAKLLSENLNREFFEMDTVIEAKEGRKIVDIFANFGEPYFRKVEKEVLKEIAAKESLIVSCGGGVVCDKENLELLKATGIIINLKASSATIYERVKKCTHRPLLNVENPLKKIEDLLKFRQVYYDQSDYFIDTDSLSVEEVVGKISELIKSNG